LVTGCTSGLGLDTARLFAARGFSIALVARDPRKLDELAREITKEYPKISVETIVQDLAVNDAAERVVQQLKQQGFDVDADSAATSQAKPNVREPDGAL
jgi:short-subunit dehydrogenase